MAFLRSLAGPFFVARGSSPRWRVQAVLLVASAAAAGAFIAHAMKWPTPIVGAVIAFPALVFSLARVRPLVVVRPDPPAALLRSLGGPFWQRTALAPTTVVRTSGDDLEIHDSGDSAPMVLRAADYPSVDLPRLAKAVEGLARGQRVAADALGSAGFTSGTGDRALREFSVRNRDAFLYVLVVVMIGVLFGVDTAMRAGN